MTDPQEARDWEAVRQIIADNGGKLGDAEITVAEALMPPEHVTLSRFAPRPHTEQKPATFDYQEGLRRRLYQHYLHALVFHLGTENYFAIETGMAGGVSTIHLLEALSWFDDAILFTLDASYSKQADMEQQIAWWDILAFETDGLWQPCPEHGQAALSDLKRWPGKLNFFLHDSDHEYENQSFEIDWAWKQLTPGGLLVVDDFVWAGGHAWAEHTARVQRPWYIIGSAAIMQKG